MTKSVIVIGGSGFLGTEILHYLKKSPAVTVACGNRKPCGIEGVADIPVDILDAASLKKACEPFDVIVNCTGQITKPINLCLKLNSEGIVNLAQCVRPNQRLIQISTVAVYGSVDFADEETVPNPETPYATAKYLAEEILGCLLPPEILTVIRLSNLYGPTQSKGLFNYLKEAYLADRHLEFDNNGELTRFYLHVSDAAQVIAEVVKSDSAQGIYNLIGADHYSIKELVKLIESLKNIAFNVEYSQAEPRENINRLAGDRIKSLVSARPNQNVKKFFSDFL